MLINTKHVQLVLMGTSLVLRVSGQSIRLIGIWTVDDKSLQFMLREMKILCPSIRYFSFNWWTNWPIDLQVDIAISKKMPPAWLKTCF